MASGVNVKMGVSGLAEFKTSMSQAKASVKTLDDELKLNEAQLKANGDAEAYMEKKSQLLKQKLEEQKSIVAQLEAQLKTMADNGVNKSSTAYQNLQSALARARTNVLTTESDLRNLGSAGNEAATSAGNVQDSLSRIGQGISFQNATSVIDGITEKLESAAKAAWNLGKQIVNATLGGGEWADELVTEASVYGLTPDQLQRMRKTSGIIDTSVEAIVGSRKKLARGLGNGTSGTMDALEFLGIDASQDVEDVFWQAGEALMQLTDETEQEAKAQALFGRSWADLIPLFEAGREEYEATNEAWNTVSDENLEKLTKMDDQFQKLQGEFETLKMTLLSTLGETLTPLMEKLTALFEEFNKYLESDEGREAMQKLGDSLMALFEDILAIKPEEVMEKVAGAIDSLKNGLDWIRDNKDSIVTALKAIAVGFAGLKVGSTVLKFLELKGALLGGGGSALSGTGTALASGASTAGTAATGAVGSGLLSTLGMAAVPAAVLAAGIIPAVIAQRHNEADWLATQEARIEAAERASEMGMETSARLLAEGAEAVGPHHDEAGNQRKMFFGQFLDIRSTAEAEQLLMGLSSRQNQQRAELASMLYGRSTTYGNDAWMELQRLWGGEAMDQGRIEAILNAVLDAESDRINAAADRMAEAAEELSGDSDRQSQTNSEMINAIGGMKGLPAMIADAVKVGLSQANIVIGTDAVNGLTNRVSSAMAQSVRNIAR